MHPPSSSFLWKNAKKPKNIPNPPSFPNRILFFLLTGAQRYIKSFQFCVDITKTETSVLLASVWCGWRDLNPHVQWTPAPQAGQSTNSSTSAFAPHLGHLNIIAGCGRFVKYSALFLGKYHSESSSVRGGTGHRDLASVSLHNTLGNRKA